ncbi:MAG: DUF5602 domain-containing protein [Labilithrix sp.]|nr:DUF5602 domain-containing protein [Labilithrix sp.]
MKNLAALGLASAVVATSAFATLTSACTTTKIVEVTDPSLDDGGAGEAGAGEGDEELTRVDGKSGELFDGTAKSFAKVNAEGTVVSVGVVFSLAALTSGPKSHPFQDDLVLDMPAVAKEQTILHHLRANWLPGGHGPTPYADPHFDFHFLRGTRAEIDDIDCAADARTGKTMPDADKIPKGYGQPELCVNAMGYHSWPKADTSGGKFTASLIMGYWAGNVVFLEPMITLRTLEKKATFEIPIAKPASAGGATTLYPTRMVAHWLEETEEYEFEFDSFEAID